ncbi:MAG: phage portal protein [Clostridium sp.]|uniref:phage portal protein n=1 Tax=Clostridium sp. TaxID=1506 RepID=UPI0039EAAC61
MFDIEANREILSNMFIRFQSVWHIYQKIYFYYLGLTDTNKIMNFYQDGVTDNAMFDNYVDGTGSENYAYINDRYNHKINTNYMKKFIKEEVSYSVGNPITYTSKSNNSSILSVINDNTSHWDEKTDENLAKNMLIYGTAYELYYIDKNGDVNSKIISPRHGYAYLDEFGDMIYFLHVFHKQFEKNNKMRIDIYTDSEIIHCDEQFNEIAERQVHSFGIVPVGIAQCSEEGWFDTIYHDVKTLQDAYEQNLSDISQEITEFRNAYLGFQNCQINDEDLPEMRKKGIINFKGDGKAEWIIKNINDIFIQNTLNTLEDKMYQMAGHVNHNVKESSNTSSLAMKAKVMELTEKCKLNQKSLQNCIKTRLQCIFNYLNSLKGSNTYDVKDIIISFTANLPQDDLLMAQVVAQLKGILSNETALSLFSFVSDPVMEMKKALKENESSTVGSNLLDQARNINIMNQNPENTKIMSDKKDMMGGDINGNK